MPIDPNTGLYVNPIGNISPGGGGTAALQILSNMLASQEAQRNQQSQNLDLATKQNAYDDSMAYQQAVQGLPDTATSDDFFKAALRNTRDPQKAAQVIQAWDYHRQMSDYHNAMANAANQNATTRATAANNRVDEQTAALIQRAVDEGSKAGKPGSEISLGLKAALGDRYTPEAEAQVNQLTQSADFQRKVKATQDRSQYLHDVAANQADRNRIARDKAAKAAVAGNKPRAKQIADAARLLNQSEATIASLATKRDAVLASKGTTDTLDTLLDVEIDRHKQLKAAYDQLMAQPDTAPKPAPDKLNPNSATPPPSATNTATVKSGATKRYDPTTGELVDIPQ